MMLTGELIGRDNAGESEAGLFEQSAALTLSPLPTRKSGQHGHVEHLSGDSFAECTKGTCNTQRPRNSGLLG